jgi:hypothetical protein
LLDIQTIRLGVLLDYWVSSSSSPNII